MQHFHFITVEHAQWSFGDRTEVILSHFVVHAPSVLGGWRELVPRDDVRKAFEVLFAVVEDAAVEQVKRELFTRESMDFEDYQQWKRAHSRFAPCADAIATLALGRD